jgi:hypothetical protein
MTRHSTNDVDGISSTRIKPPLLRNAWRAALVMSSDTINPSRQQRSEIHLECALNEQELYALAIEF